MRPHIFTPLAHAHRVHVVVVVSAGVGLLLAFIAQDDLQRADMHASATEAGKRVTRQASISYMQARA